MRSQYTQGQPKIKFYRDYKSLKFESFNNELNWLLKSEKDINSSLFENIFLQILSAHAPGKKKIQKCNNNPFKTKQLRKAIMQHSRLKTGLIVCYYLMLYVIIMFYCIYCMLLLFEHKFPLWQQQLVWGTVKRKTCVSRKTYLFREIILLYLKIHANYFSYFRIGSFHDLHLTLILNFQVYR